MRMDLTRRGFLQVAASTAVMAPHIARSQSARRIIIVMCDGLGIEYYDQSAMPRLKDWAAAGLYVRAQGVMPSVTNCNNASICCGTWPSEHGVIGNSWFDEATGREEYMEDASLVLAPTIFQRARAHGIHSALLSAKKKTVSLLNRGADIVLTAEAPDGSWEARLGPAPNIYSREINYWVFAAALDILRNRPEIGLIYVHTTDYPMHMWPPEARESREHLAHLDDLLGEVAAAAPDAAILLTADHSMNSKSRCWDLGKALQNRGAPVRIAISAERDRYLVHHQGMGGTAWVHLRSHADEARVGALLSELDGVERVLTRTQAANELKLMPSRIGDFVVIGNRNTVFGELDCEMEVLPANFRSHGSFHEINVPVILHNAVAAPPVEYFRHNFDLARWMYPV